MQGLHNDLGEADAATTSETINGLWVGDRVEEPAGNEDDVSDARPWRSQRSCPTRLVLLSP